jgi:hypothetical protein
LPQVLVTVRNCGLVCDESVLEIGSTVEIGDSRRAVVRFPGGVKRLYAAGNKVFVDGASLVVGERRLVQTRPVEVEVELLHAENFEFHDVYLPDLRLFVATLSIVLLAIWLDQVSGVVREKPALVAGLLAVVSGTDPEIVQESLAPAKKEYPDAEVRWIGEIRDPSVGNK